MRTKEQLGYIVGSTISIYSHMAHFKLYLMSKVANPDKLESRLNAYLQDKKETWDPTDEEIKNVVDAKINLLNQKATSLGKEAMRHWDQITDDYFDFDLKEQKIAAY